MQYPLVCNALLTLTEKLPQQERAERKYEEYGYIHEYIIVSAGLDVETAGATEPESTESEPRKEAPTLNAAEDEAMERNLVDKVAAIEGTKWRSRSYPDSS